MILEVGFNGIADTIWVEDWETKICDRSSDGSQCAGISRKLKSIARQGIIPAMHVNVRLFFTGPMTVENINL